MIAETNVLNLFEYAVALDQNKFKEARSLDV